jgi:acetyl-CoA acyltransferase
MREDVATALGYTPLGFIRSYAYAAIDPAEQLLQAPVFAAPKALERAGVTLADIAVVEMHEAFAAQVLSNVQGLASRTWGERAGLPGPVGEIDPERLNVMGGSIAIGHPFGATGARVLTTLLNELNRRNGQFGLMTVCAAGGLGHAMVVERA